MTERTRRPVSSLTDADRWRAALDECRAALPRESYSPATADRVVKQAGRFAAESPCGPWDVTPAGVSAWLDGLACSVRAKYAYRTSLRTFYRWAVRSGRALTDPTAALPVAMSPRSVPLGWLPAIDAFLAYLRASSTAPETVKLRRYQLRSLARGVPVASPWDVTAADLLDWHGRHAWSRETARSVRAALRSFYGWAVAVGYLDASPADALPRVHLVPHAPRPVPDEDYRQALALADDRVSLMVRLSAELGLRRGEVARCHTRDVQRGTDGGLWLTVCGKGERTRWLPLPRSLSLALSAVPPGYVFPGRIDGHLSPARVGELVTAALPVGVTMHALRHRFATRAYAVNRDVLTVQQLLGHASPVTTQRYVQVPRSALRHLVETIAG